jgi:hypothetical protein
MHVPVTPSGDGAADARAVAAALLDGRAACVLDGVAPASGLRLARAADGALELAIAAPDLSRARFALLRDGARVAEAPAPLRGGPAVVRLPCAAGACPPGDYRVEATWDGRPWIFTNPLAIE